jgi:hypothetical protein
MKKRDLRPSKEALRAARALDLSRMTPQMRRIWEREFSDPREKRFVPHDQLNLFEASPSRNSEKE